jgi:hypothetical protein
MRAGPRLRSASAQLAVALAEAAHPRFALARRPGAAIEPQALLIEHLFQFHSHPSTTRVELVELRQPVLKQVNL